MKISDGTYVYEVQELEDGGESRDCRQPCTANPH